MPFVSEMVKLQFGLGMKILFLWSICVFMLIMSALTMGEAQRARPSAVIGPVQSPQEPPALAPEIASKIELAKEYLNRQDYEKALPLFSKLANDDQAQPIVHDDFVKTLVALSKNKELERYLKRCVKRYDDVPLYRAQYISFLQANKRYEDAREALGKLQDVISKRPNLTASAAEFFLKAKNDSTAELLFLTGRRALNDPLAFTYELSEIYRNQGKTDLLISEMLSLLERDYNNLYMVQAVLQNSLQKETEMDALRRVLLTRVAQSPDNQIYPELLLWLNLQKRDFSGAFIQAKSLDKRNNAPGYRCAEVGQLAMQNKDYAAAIPIFLYVSETWQDKNIYINARRNYIFSRQQIAVQGWPVPVDEFRAIVREYQSLNDKSRGYPIIGENMRQMAIIYAQYLNRPDSAQALLETLIDQRLGDQNTIDQAKLNLGDIYLLKGVYGEAMLLYYQVEKTQKETPLGHEAKLRNAKLSYYRGEFQMAKEHLDVLKLATSREIANDAMDLGLLIQDNTAFDSTGKALKVYSRAELMLYRHQEAQALSLLDSLAATKPGEEMEEEILFLKAKLYRQSRRIDQALALYQELTSKYPNGLYADDALFAQADIQETYKANPTLAMELYSNLLKDYPGSIFVAEARKRFRLLRGDKLN